MPIVTRDKTSNMLSQSTMKPSAAASIPDKNRVGNANVKGPSKGVVDGLNALKLQLRRPTLLGPRLQLEVHLIR